MNEFIDIHNHFAWEVDDGMDSKENAIHALDDAAKDGVKTIVSTPHFIPGRFNQRDYDEITNRISELKDLAQSKGIEVYFGSEIFLNDDYFDMIDKKLFHTLANSEYILVEFDVRKDINDNDSAEDKLYELVLAGYKVIIAHVERYFHSKLDLERVKNWIDMGCYVQINRTSILGKNGMTALDNAEKLIKANMAHLVASDAHSDTGSRICKMSDVYNELSSSYGNEVANVLCLENPKHIINNEELADIEVKKQPLLKKLFRRG